jgi:hypothetical protein
MKCHYLRGKHYPGYKKIFFENKIFFNQIKKKFSLEIFYSNVLSKKTQKFFIFSINFPTRLFFNKKLCCFSNYFKNNLVFHRGIINFVWHNKFFHSKFLGVKILEKKKINLKKNFFIKQFNSLENFSIKIKTKKFYEKIFLRFKIVKLYYFLNFFCFSIPNSFFFLVNLKNQVEENIYTYFFKTFFFIINPDRVNIFFFFKKNFKELLLNYKLNFLINRNYFSENFNQCIKSLNFLLKLLIFNFMDRFFKINYIFRIYKFILFKKKILKFLSKTNFFLKIHLKHKYYNFFSFHDYKKKNIFDHFFFHFFFEQTRIFFYYFSRNLYVNKKFLDLYYNIFFFLINLFKLKKKFGFIKINLKSKLYNEIFTRKIRKSFLRRDKNNTINFFNTKNILFLFGKYNLNLIFLNKCYDIVLIFIWRKYGKIFFKINKQLIKKIFYFFINWDLNISTDQKNKISHFLFIKWQLISNFKKYLRIIKKKKSNQVRFFVLIGFSFSKILRILDNFDQLMQNCREFKYNKILQNKFTFIEHYYIISIFQVNKNNSLNINCNIQSFQSLFLKLFRIKKDKKKTSVPNWGKIFFFWVMYFIKVLKKNIIVSIYFKTHFFFKENIFSFQIFFQTQNTKNFINYCNKNWYRNTFAINSEIYAKKIYTIFVNKFKKKYIHNIINFYSCFYIKNYQKSKTFLNQNIFLKKLNLKFFFYLYNSWIQIYSNKILKSKIFFIGSIFNNLKIKIKLKNFIIFFDYKLKKKKFENLNKISFFNFKGLNSLKASSILFYFFKFILNKKNSIFLRLFFLKNLLSFHIDFAKKFLLNYNSKQNEKQILITWYIKNRSLIYKLPFSSKNSRVLGSF